MKRYFTPKLLFVFFIALPSFLLAQLPGTCTTKNRIAIAGDSWAQYMADDDTHNKTLSMYGHGDKKAISDTYEISIGCSGSPGPDVYAVSGSLAREWADEVEYDYLQNLIDACNGNPDIDFILLSIGGNDILAARSGGGWYKNMDLDEPGSEQALFDEITDDMMYIMEEVWDRARPDINFVISSYDFPNFNVEWGLLCDQYACPKREDLSRDDDNSGEIESDELITDAEINAMMDLVEGIRKDIADANSQIYYDNGMGLMHYYYGFDDDTYPDFPPASTPHPQGESPWAPGGDIDIPSDRENFRSIYLCDFLGPFSADPIHLDEEGYEFKIKNQFDNIFFEEFRGIPDETFWSVAAEDGYTDVLEMTATSDGIRVGDNDTGWFGLDNEYRGILSFNTGSIPGNAEVTGASIYMIRSSENDNPFLHNDRSPVLDIKTGYFGDDPALDWSDGHLVDAPADAANIGCFHGLAEEDKYAIRIDIEESALEHINLNGATQFRMYFDEADWSPEYINFYDGGGNEAFMPPEDESRNSPTIYNNRVIKRIHEADGTVREVELERGNPVTKRPGYVYQEKLSSAYENDEGDVIASFVVVEAIEHPGLAKHMSDTYGAPADGYAPFMDVTYSVPLPVELAEFTARPVDQTAKLTWTTYSESNMNGYEIEHSIDARNWSSIGFVKSEGDHNDHLDYNFVHEQPAIGTNYYRLQMLDMNETKEQSEIRQVDFGKNNTLASIYPNPFKDHLTFEMDFEMNGTATIQLSDVLGRVVLEQTINTTAGLREYQLNGLDQLSVGTYMIRVFDGFEVVSGKVVKE